MSGVKGRLGGQFDVSADAASLAGRVADWLIAKVATHPGVCRVALSGGSTPKRMFAMLAAPARAAAMDWDRLEVFWGDERYVGEESPDSNAGEARRRLLDLVPIARERVHAIPSGPSPEAAAAAYAATLRGVYGADVLERGRPLFDVVFLGLGEDGHTASLIPGQPVLAERTAWVAAVGAGRPEVRITLTYLALESAGVVAFLVEGASKRAVVAAMRDGTADGPAAKLRPEGGVVWFVDRAAMQP